MKLLKWLNKIFDYSSNGLAFLGGVLFIFIMIITVVEVVMRYIFNSSLSWSLEIVQFSLLWIAFLATAWVLKRNGHVKMDIIINLLNPRIQPIFNAITYTIGAMTCFLLTGYGVVLTLDYFHKGSFFQGSLESPKFIVLAVIPIGFFLLAIEFLKKAYVFIRNHKTLSKQ